MRRILYLSLGGVVVCTAILLVRAAESNPSTEDRLWHLRNLGKAFYENPTTQLQAVDEFRKALELRPDSARERLNYGLALLRAGKTQEGVAEIEKAQKQDPSIPHTWFNLGIAYKKESEYEKAIVQLEQMAKLVPDEPVTHYNLGVLYKLAGRAEDSLKEFETAARLDPNLAGPHFQLYNAYRQAGRSEDASRELKMFQAIKQKTQGAAVPEDMEWSFYSEIMDPIEPLPAAGPAAAVKLAASEVAVKAAGLTALDASGAGRADLVAWSGEGVTLLEGGKNPVAASGLGAIKGAAYIAAGDFDNDGLPDLAVVSAGGAALYQNQQGKFARHAAELPSGRYRAALWVDYDHDYDLDLLLLGEDSRLLRNNGAEGFSDETSAFPFVKGTATHGAIFELVADTTGADVVVTYQDGPPVLYRDRLLAKYEAQPLADLPSGMTQAAPFDVNNDGWMDLALAGPQGVLVALNKDGKLQAGAKLDAAAPVVFADLESRGFADLVASGKVFRNLGQGKFEISATAVPKALALATADFDGDGREDLASAASNVRMLRNETDTSHQWMRIALTGVKNLKLAPGAEVEVKAGSLYQKRVYHGVPLVFGLRGSNQADTVRITWPNGLIQNETRQPAGKTLAYKEAQRLSGSCPMIFTWNGREFEYITDVLAVAPLGASAGGGEFFPVDHDEYVQIRGESLAPADGRYEIRITEELREVAYLDHVRLIAVDHPADTSIFTNDKFKAPPFPEFRLYGVKERRYPVAARLTSRSLRKPVDVLDRLTRLDQRYPDQFQRDYAGVAERQTLELDFGQAAPDNRAVLVLSGWVDWADGSTFLGAAQSSREGLIMPYLQVKNARGEWQTVIEDLGIPAGKPKTIAVDLTGKFLTADRRVRIVTNLCLYWDEIFLGEDPGAPAVRLTELAARDAELRFRGFSRAVIHPERKQPESFVYGQVSPTSMWNPTPGLYTRYGPVLPLLERIDDNLLIMGSGDELRLRFGAEGLPALPNGWRRDFLLMVDGWAKDGDANTAHSQTVEPLPFHGMSRYPYPAPERFPESRLQREYTTRPALRLLRPLSEGRIHNRFRVLREVEGRR